jgi:Domain of unknown function (DU1801)
MEYGRTLVAAALDRCLAVADAMGILAGRSGKRSAACGSVTKARHQVPRKCARTRKRGEAERLGPASIGHEMDTAERVEAYLASQPEPKQTDLRQLHAHMLADFPECELWFNDGTNEDGKVVANPNIGYGVYTRTYADGSSREFYRIGLSANTTGISVYVLGLNDKTYLTRTYGASIGKASVTGYCIKFKRLSDINAEALHAAIRYGITVDRTSRGTP